KLQGLEQQNAEWEATLPPFHPNSLLVASRWTLEIADFAQRGGNGIVFVEKGGGLPVVECPFWREAMKLFEEHPLWEEFPHEGFTDLIFYGLGPDCAFDREELQALLPDATLSPILRRVDARTFDVKEYVLEA